MITEFKDRKQETKELKSLLKSDKFELIILYGRRRIGKTELSLHSTKGLKRIYYLATEENNLERFYNISAQAISNVSRLKPDWEILFDYLKDKVDVIIIDEFQNLIIENKNIISLFQSIVDTILKDSKLKLILLGSSVSMINSKVLSYKSPLYGRRTASLKLKPISFFDLKEFFPDKSIEELVKIYGFADGIPAYLTRIDGKFDQWINNELKKATSFLRDEIDFIIKYEFKEVNTYKTILEAIARGNTKLNDIKNFSKLKRTDLSPYLRNLIEIDFIKREVPVSDTMNSRKGRYYFKDNFLRFWFRFIYPNLSLIEERRFALNNYNSYLGFIFEDICKQSLHGYNKVGKWWHKDIEIDIVALRNKEILFAECKWKNNVNPITLLQKLKAKSTYVPHNGLKEKYAIFAKSFTKKLSNCYDLNDLKEMLKPYHAKH